MNTAIKNPALIDSLDYLAGHFSESVASLLNGDVRPFVLDNRARRHLWLAILDQSEATAHSALIRFGWLANADDLVGWAAEWANVLRSTFKRLPAQALLPGQYVALADRIRRRPRSARILNQLGQLDQRTIDIILALPDPLVEVSLIRMIDHPSRAETLAQLFKIALSVGRTEREVATALHSATNWAAVEKVMERAVMPEALPVAPCPSDARVQSITKLADLRRLGGEYKNCLRSFRRQPFGFQKECAYFLWNGTENAVIAVTRDVIGSWRIDEVRLAGNEIPSPETEIAIEIAFSDVGIGSGPDTIDLLMRL